MAEWQEQTATARSLPAQNNPPDSLLLAPEFTAIINSRNTPSPAILQYCFYLETLQRTKTSVVRWYSTLSISPSTPLAAVVNSILSIIRREACCPQLFILRKIMHAYMKVSLSKCRDLLLSKHAQDLNV